MKALKILVRLLLVALGVLVGGFLSAQSGGLVFGGVVLGGLLAGLLVFLVPRVVSGRTSGARPYDRLNERDPVHSSGAPQTPEARISRTQDALMDEVMHFPPPRR